VDLVEHVADRIRIKAVEIARTHQFTFERDLSVERVCRHAYRERTLCLSMHLDQLSVTEDRSMAQERVSAAPAARPPARLWRALLISGVRRTVLAD
jgi:hypothetical protein